MTLPPTREPQYALLLDVKEKHGVSRLGLMVNESWNQDPKRTLFTLARYKFVARMLAGDRHVLEVGCADAFGTRIVQQAVKKVTAVDFDPLFVADACERMNPHWLMEIRVHDMLEGPVPGTFDAAYALDVLEHISPADEPRFIANTIASLTPQGIAIFGMPSLESQRHASPQSKAGHVNCKGGEEFKRGLERYFHSVFMFSMNDEVVHTGFYPMAHYLLGVACHRRDSGTRT
jgi:cyclopropane fatty-acyl-phospholipid synthase-like methyltransferase